MLEIGTYSKDGLDGTLLLSSSLSFYVKKEDGEAILVDDTTIAIATADEDIQFENDDVFDAVVDLLIKKREDKIMSDAIDQSNGSNFKVNERTSIGWNVPDTIPEDVQRRKDKTKTNKHHQNKNNIFSRFITNKHKDKDNKQKNNFSEYINKRGITKETLDEARVRTQKMLDEVDNNNQDNTVDSTADNNIDNILLALLSDIIVSEGTIAEADDNWKILVGNNGFYLGEDVFKAAEKARNAYSRELMLNNENTASKSITEPLNGINAVKESNNEETSDEATVALSFDSSDTLKCLANCLGAISYETEGDKQLFHDKPLVSASGEGYVTRLFVLPELFDDDDEPLKEEEKKSSDATVSDVNEINDEYKKFLPQGFFDKLKLNDETQAEEIQAEVLSDEYRYLSYIALEASPKTGYRLAIIVPTKKMILCAAKLSSEASSELGNDMLNAGQKVINKFA